MAATVSEDDIGRAVAYRPYPGAPPERGVVTSFNADYVFVRYVGDRSSKVTRLCDLDWVDPPRSARPRRDGEA